jgi:uncharacterized membrane protein YqjE
METMEAQDNGPSAGDLLSRIAGDLKTIAHDEVELVGDELRRVARTAATEAAAALVGALVALIGFGMLCVAGVVALAPVIPSLALRLLLGALVYGSLGAVVAAMFAKRLRRDAVPDLSVPAHEARATVQGVKATLAEAGRTGHA